MIPSEFDEELLTEEALVEHEEYLSLYDNQQCYCSATPMPPCGFCEGGGTHPGNPLNLMEDEDAWKEPVDLMTTIRQAAEEGQPS